MGTTILTTLRIDELVLGRSQSNIHHRSNYNQSSRIVFTVRHHCSRIVLLTLPFHLLAPFMGISESSGRHVFDRQLRTVKWTKPELYASSRERLSRSNGPHFLALTKPTTSYAVGTTIRAAGHAASSHSRTNLFWVKKSQHNHLISFCSFDINLCKKYILWSRCRFHWGTWCLVLALSCKILPSHLQLRTDATLYLHYSRSWLPFAKTQITSQFFVKVTYLKSWVIIILLFVKNIGQNYHILRNTQCW